MPGGAFKNSISNAKSFQKKTQIGIAGRGAFCAAPLGGGAHRYLLRHPREGQTRDVKWGSRKIFGNFLSETRKSRRTYAITAAFQGEGTRTRLSSAWPDRNAANLETACVEAREKSVLERSEQRGAVKHDMSRP